MDAFLSGMPKAELHIHVEGALEPELMLALGRHHGVALPWRDPDEARAAYAFTDLQSFLDLYYRGMDVLRTASDFTELARSYLARAHADGVRHAEIFFDPQAHTARGVPLSDVLDGLERALEEAASVHGMSGGLILCFLRHLPPEAAAAMLEEARPFADRLLGVGLDSSERGHPPEPFADVFARARGWGLRAVAHAGEEGPPAHVAGALDALGAERIDHGVRCLEDPALVERLVAERVPLTVCPLSNVRLGVCERMADHVLPRLLGAGLSVSIHSDDPAYFGGYVADNYRAVAHDLGLGRGELVQLARNSFAAAFLDPPRRAARLDELATWVAARDLE